MRSKATIGGMRILPGSRRMPDVFALGVRGSSAGLPSRTVVGVAEAPGPMVRSCRREDLDWIAAIHKSQFDTSVRLLGRLSSALIAALYEEFIDRSIFLLHTDSCGEIDGFVLGGPSPAMLHCRLAFLRRRGLLWGAEVACRPRLWLRSLRSIFHLLENWMGTVAGDGLEEDFRLLSIAVAAVRCGEASAQR